MKTVPSDSVFSSFDLIRVFPCADNHPGQIPTNSHPVNRAGLRRWEQAIFVQRENDRLGRTIPEYFERFGRTSPDPQNRQLKPCHSSNQAIGVATERTEKILAKLLDEGRGAMVVKISHHHILEAVAALQ